MVNMNFLIAVQQARTWQDVVYWGISCVAIIFVAWFFFR